MLLRCAARTCQVNKDREDQGWTYGDQGPCRLPLLPFSLHLLLSLPFPSLSPFSLPLNPLYHCLVSPPPPLSPEPTLCAQAVLEKARLWVQDLQKRPTTLDGQVDAYVR
jgi:hypothetical protein